MNTHPVTYTQIWLTLGNTGDVYWDGKTNILLVAPGSNENYLLEGQAYVVYGVDSSLLDDLKSFLI